MSNEEREIRRRKQVLQYAADTGNIRLTCRHFAIPRSLFYIWRDRFEREGEAGLVRRKPIARRHPRAIAPEIEEKVLYLRRTYHLGPTRIMWYLQRYHGIKISDATAYRICRRHGLNRLPGRVGRRAVHTHRYAKQVPGHHVQVDVTFLTLKTKRGRQIRRFQYTAIDDATRIRALKMYDCHNTEQMSPKSS